MANFKIGNQSPQRFAGDFLLEKEQSGYAPTPDEQIYLAKLHIVLNDLARDEEQDTADKDRAGSGLVLARQEKRTQAAFELKEEAQEFIDGRLAPDFAADNVLVIKGKYVGNLKRLSNSLFVVQEKIESGHATDLKIDVAANLPPPNDIPSPDKQTLYVAIDSASMVIKTVCQHVVDRANKWFNRRYFPRRIQNEGERAARLLDEYVRKLAGIGRLGLEGPHTQLATLALDGLRREFVAQEAGRIKNAYVRSLGVAAGMAGVIFLTMYTLVQTDWLTYPFWVIHKSFLLAGAGAALGTWLSFSIRRVQLSFDDLAILEEDLLDPSVRVIFVIGLTFTACLLFWTGAINLEIGNLKTAPAFFAGATAFLVGVFCGIAERALATAVSGRAAAFVKSVGGGT